MCDFLTAVPASSLTRLVSRYSTSLENRQDLPRLPICFIDMPCSQTPGTPLTTAHPVASDVVFWKNDAIDHPNSCTLTGLNHFNLSWLTACKLSAYA